MTDTLYRVDADSLAAVRAYCDNSFFGAKILSELDTYGINTRHVSAWYGESGGCVNAVLLAGVGTATLVAEPTAAYKSLARLLPLTGIQSVMGVRDCIRRLGLPIAEAGAVMRAERLSQQSLHTVRLVDEETLDQLYDVLYGTGARAKNPLSFAFWYPDISHRVRHKTASLYAIDVDGKPVSCAAILYENAVCGCIGGVATLPAYRGRGYASAVTLAAAQAILARKKTPMLARNSNKTEHLYTNLGFVNSETWGRAVLDARL